MSDGILWDNVNVVGSWFCNSLNQVIVADNVTTMVTTEAPYAFYTTKLPNQALEKLTGSRGTRGLVMVKTEDVRFLVEQGWLEQVEFNTAFARGRVWRLTPAGLKRFCDQPEPTS